MGPTWVLSAPYGPHYGRMNLAIRVSTFLKDVITYPCHNLPAGLANLCQYKWPLAITMADIFLVDTQYFNTQAMGVSSLVSD